MTHSRAATMCLLSGALVVVAFGAAGCTGDNTQIVSRGGNNQIEDEPDESPPVLTHDPVTDAQPYGQAVEMLAEAVDEGGGSVFIVQVFFKTETSSVWVTSTLTNDGETDTWVGTIPADKVTGGGMDYYLFAVDDSNNEAFEPEEGESDPYHFRVY